MALSDKKSSDTEYQLQVNIFDWAKQAELIDPRLHFLHASLNGVKLTIGQAVKAAASGMRSGVPDIFLPVPNDTHHGLFIELKSKKGKPTTKQLQWIDFLTTQGYYAKVCVGDRDAIKTIADYLENKCQ